MATTDVILYSTASNVADVILTDGSISASSVSGTFAATEDADTLAATATLEVSGTYAATEGEDALSAVGTVEDAVTKVGGDDAFHPGWNKEAWQARQKREDAIADTIAETYNRILGIEPEPEVVAEIAAVVAEKAAPVADYSGVSEWLQAQERIVADLIAQRAEEDDEETILMLIG